MSEHHYLESVAALASAHDFWKPVHSGIVLALWAKSTDPLAVRPRVQINREVLSHLLAVQEDYLRHRIAELRGIAYSIEGCGGQSRSYVLLRPVDHETANTTAAIARAAATASVDATTIAEAVAAGVAAALQGLNRSAARKPRVKGAKANKPNRHSVLARLKVKRSDVAGRLAAAFGCAEPWFNGAEVNSTLDWFATDPEADLATLDLVLDWASKDTDKPVHPERIFMASHAEWFERIEAEILADETETEIEQ